MSMLYFNESKPLYYSLLPLPNYSRAFSAKWRFPGAEKSHYKMQQRKDASLVSSLVFCSAPEQWFFPQWLREKNAICTFLGESRWPEHRMFMTEAWERTERCFSPGDRVKLSLTCPQT
jgi:hypothetical protein